MLTAARGARGFSLIELMFSIAVAGILLTLGMPTFTAWINNTKIRTAAESIANGLQLARAEAVRLNASVQFVLGGVNDPNQTAAWLVNWPAGTQNAAAAPPNIATAWIVNQTTSAGVQTLQVRTLSGTSNATQGILPAGGNAFMVTYTGIGSITANIDGSPTITQVDVCSSASMEAGTMRKMRITVGAGGNVKMCDPQLPTTDPRGCPVVAASQC